MTLVELRRSKVPRGNTAFVERVDFLKGASLNFG